MSRINTIHLVLPFHEMVSDHSPLENLLLTVGTNTKDLVELFLTEWVNFKNGRYDFNYGQELSQDRSGKQTSSNNAFDRYRESYRMNAYVLAMDIIFGAIERKVERGERPNLEERDRRDVEKVMMSIWNSVSNYVLDLLLEFSATPEMLEELRFERWIGDDILISLPRRHRSLDRQTKEETAHAANEKTQTTFCHNDIGGGNK